MPPMPRALQQQAQCWLCPSRPPLTLRLRVDAPSENCRILSITMGEFVTDASTNVCWQAALVPVDCSSNAPQMHSKLQMSRASTTSSCSSATAVDEAASTNIQPANSHGRGWHHDRARQPTLPIAKLFLLEAVVCGHILHVCGRLVRGFRIVAESECSVFSPE